MGSRSHGCVLAKDGIFCQSGPSRRTYKNMSFYSTSRNQDICHRQNLSLATHNPSVEQLVAKLFKLLLFLQSSEKGHFLYVKL